jgi:hypothetical protein
MRQTCFARLRGLFGAALIAGSIGLSPAAAEAQEWSGQITLYGWGAGVTGDVTPVPGTTLSFDKSLSEVLEDLDGAFFINGLARRGDLVLLGDLTYSRSSRDGLLPPGIPASGEVTMRSLTLAAGRHFDLGGGSAVAVLGGLRAWSIDAAVSVPLAGVNVSPGMDFIDPVIAVRGVTPLSDRWSLLGYLDVGGFGVGSDLTWQAAVAANYQASDNLYLSVGWRHLFVDYASGGSAFQGAMTGPVVGATFRF